MAAPDRLVGLGHNGEGLTVRKINRRLGAQAGVLQPPR